MVWSPSLFQTLPNRKCSRHVYQWGSTRHSLAPLWIHKTHCFAPTWQPLHSYIHTYIHTYVRTYIHSYKTFYARSQTFEKRLLALSCLSVRMEQLGFRSMNFHEIWYFSISQKSVQKIQVSLLLTRMTGTLHEDVCTFMTSSHWILLREKYFKEK